MARKFASVFSHRSSIWWGAISLVLVAFLWPGTASLSGDAKEKRERIVIGPFKLGDWFAESEVKVGGVFNLGAPEHAEIVKSLNECEAYVIDERISGNGKHAKFGEPKLAITGKLDHVFESKSGSFAIHITQLNIWADNTDYSKKPATRRVRLGLQMKTTGSNGVARTTSTIGFAPKEAISYNIDGRSK